MESDVLQAICRDYLSRLRTIASKRGLSDWLDDIIIANKNKECKATESEVEMLSRMCDDERVMRTDIPHMLGKSYRQCNDDGDFEKVRTLKRVGIYSKISALLLANKHHLT